LTGGVGMGTRKRIIVGFLIFVLLVSIILISYGGCNLHLRNQAFNFAEIIENENIDDLSLTIYYVKPFGFLTPLPWSVEFFISYAHDGKIVISGNDLEEFIDLFKQINNDILTPLMRPSYLDVRLYYVLESRENGKLFDVVMWDRGPVGNIVVNGFAVKDNPIFYDAILPFLPEYAAEQWGRWSSKGSSTQ